MKKILFLLLLTGLIATSAQAQIRITKSADRKQTINLSGLSVAGDASSQTFIKTLEKDLKSSGWLMPQRTASDLQLVGSVSQNSGKISMLRASDQANLLNKNYPYEAARVRAMAHQAADDIIYAATGKRGFASTKIALVSSAGKKKEIFICDADGGGLTQITRDNSIAIAPQWTPAGEALIYTSFLRDFPDTYSINLKSGKRSLLSSYSGINSGGTISPNGVDMALTLSKDGNPELYVKNLKTGQLRRLTKSEQATEASPSWSPDGKNLVYVSDQSGSPQLYIISSAGGTPRRLTRRGSENVSPDWGANNMIVCSSRDAGRYNIALIDPASGTTKYLPNDGADYEDPSWAPNGRHLVATRSVRYQSSIYLLDTIGDPPVALVSDGKNWVSPAWSPR